MDEVRAKRMSAELLNQEVGGWRVERYISAGKSALVFEAQRSGNAGALKVFDPELVERYGRGVQVERIRRECSLIGDGHPHLIRVLDGGECGATNMLFVVMDLLRNVAPLSSVIATFPRDKIRSTISRVASAARYLLERYRMAHRDIKPDNIVVDSTGTVVTLLDLGVVRPIGDSDLTDDGDSRPFIGTLRYASPEFLLRQEEDTENGWTALTFYQLGAVLHDLIVGRQLFAMYGDPFARLVTAIEREQPVIEAEDVAPDLVSLARNCLVKDPKVRLSLVQWSDFDESPPAISRIDAAERRIRERIVAAGTRRAALNSHDEGTARRRIAELHSQIEEAIRQECDSNSLFPPSSLERIDGFPTSFLTVHIASDQDFALFHNLGIRFHFQLEGVASSVVQIGFDAWVGTVPTSPLAATRIILRGVFSMDVVRRELRTALTLALDAAQAVKLGDATGMYITEHMQLAGTTHER